MVVLILLLLLAGVLGILAIRQANRRPRPGCGWLTVIVVALMVLVLPKILIGPMGGLHPALESAAMQTCRVLALAMFSYANDHDDRYPDGKSSTEVFQKLLDGNYISDPNILFVPLPGKVRSSGSKLKPENVAYDVTTGVDGHSSDSVPIVFLTGFRLEYRSGGSAISRVKPFPSTAAPLSSWFNPFQHRDREVLPILFDGLPVAYTSNNAWFRQARSKEHPVQYTPDGFGIVPDIIPFGLDLQGQTYRQLTPEGPLEAK